MTAPQNEQPRHSLLEKLRAFTLAELVIAVVVTTIIAGVGVSTFQSSQVRSQDEVARSTLASASRIAAASRLLRGNPPFTDADFVGNNASGDASQISMGSAVVSESSGVAFTDGTSLEFGVVAYAISADRMAAAVAMMSQSGTCFGQMVSGSTGVEASALAAVAVARCTGRAAGAEIIGWSPVDPPRLPIYLEVTQGRPKQFDLPPVMGNQYEFALTPEGPWSQGVRFPGGQLHGTALGIGYTPDRQGTLTHQVFYTRNRDGQRAFSDPVAVTIVAR